MKQLALKFFMQYNHRQWRKIGNYLLLFSTFLILFFPLIVFFHLNGNHTAGENEALAYRFFFLYRLHLKEHGLIWLPQGFLTSLLQKIIFYIINYFNVTEHNLQYTVESFASSTLILQSFIGLLILFFILRDFNITFLQKITILTGLVISIYIIAPGLEYHFSPDYYQLNIILYPLLSYLYLKIICNLDTFSSKRSNAYLGILAGLLIANKISLLLPAALLCVPILFTYFKKPLQLLNRLLIFFLCAAIVCIGIILLLYGSMYNIIQLVYPIWWKFIQNRKEPNFYHLITQHRYLQMSVIYFITVAMALCVAKIKYNLNHKTSFIISLFILSTIPVILTVVYAPAGSTLFEVFLYLTYITIAILASLAKFPQVRKIIYCFLLVCSIQLYTMHPIHHTIQYVREYFTNGEATWRSHEILKSYKKPVIVVIPDNNSTPIARRTVEMTLLKGFSDIPSWNISTGKIGLNRLQPNTSFRTEYSVTKPNDAYPKNSVIAWFDHLDSLQLLKYPKIQEIIKDKHTICREHTFDQNFVMSTCEFNE